MKSKHRSLLDRSKASAFFITLSVAAMGHATLQASSILVNWGGNYVDNDQLFNGSYTNVDNLDLDGDASNDDSRFGYAYNAATPAPLSPSTGYSGTSGTFYGGFVISTINNASSLGETLQPNAQGVHQNGATDHIKFQTQHSENHHHTFGLFTYWDKTDFLNGGSTATITLDSLSSFSLDIRNSSNFTDGAHLHFVIRNGSQFYTSQAFYNGVSSSGETGYLGTIPDGGTATYNPSIGGYGWKEYNPDGLALQWTHGSYSPQTFNNITAVGYYFDTLAFSQNNNNLEITGFNFSAVPEPSAAILGIGSAAMLLLRRRRR